MSVREESRSDSLSLEFKLASFQAQLETFAEQSTSYQDEAASLRSSLDKTRAQLVEKDELLQRLTDADNEQFKRAVARVEALSKEKGKIQELYSQSQLQVKELAAQHEAYEARKQAMPDLASTKQVHKLSNGSKVERAMIDALAKEQKRIQARLDKLESKQEELLDVAKNAQANHLAMSTKILSIQSEAKRAVETLKKAITTLCKERKTSKDLAAKLHVAQTQVDMHQSQITYLQDQLSKTG